MNMRERELRATHRHCPSHYSLVKVVVHPSDQVLLVPPLLWRRTWPVTAGAAPFFHGLRVRLQSLRRPPSVVDLRSMELDVAPLVVAYRRWLSMGTSRWRYKRMKAHWCWFHPVTVKQKWFWLLKAAPLWWLVAGVDESPLQWSLASCERGKEKEMLLVCIPICGVLGDLRSTRGQPSPILNKKKRKERN